MLRDEEDIKATEENDILSTLWLKRANTSGQEAGQFRANGNVETSQTGRQRPKAGRAAVSLPLEGCGWNGCEDAWLSLELMGFNRQTDEETGDLG